MLPDSQNIPTKPSEGLVDNSVANFIPGKFLFPERTIGSGLGRVFRAAMPETAIHKNREFELWKNEIRFAEDFWMSPPADDFVPTK